MHKWAPEDDIVAFYLYRFESRSKIRGIPYSFEQIAGKIGTSIGSLDRRMGNFEALDGAGNLDHWAMISEAVYHEYGDVAEQDHRSEVLKILRS